MPSIDNASMMSGSSLRVIFSACLLLACWMITGCNDAVPQEQPTKESKDEFKELQTREVIVGLASGDAGKFCVIGKSDDGEPFQLWTTGQNSEMRKNGKIQVAIRDGKTVASEFYNDAELAVKSVTDRGVLKFYKCSNPLDM